jgi:hypothetical protein
MARVIKRSRLNPETIDSHDAYNRAQMRADDLEKALEDPQVGPVEDRGTPIRTRGKAV